MILNHDWIVIRHEFNHIHIRRWAVFMLLLLLLVLLLLFVFIMLANNVVVILIHRWFTWHAFHALCVERERGWVGHDKILIGLDVLSHKSFVIHVDIHRWWRGVVVVPIGWWRGRGEWRSGWTRRRERPCWVGTWSCSCLICVWLWVTLTLVILIEHTNRSIFANSIAHFIRVDPHGQLIWEQTLECLFSKAHHMSCPSYYWVHFMIDSKTSIATAFEWFVWKPMVMIMAWKSVHHSQSEWL